MTTEESLEEMRKRIDALEGQLQSLSKMFTTESILLVDSEGKAAGRLIIQGDADRACISLRNEDMADRLVADVWDGLPQIALYGKNSQMLWSTPHPG